MSPRTIWTVLIVVAVALLIWTVIITAALAVFLLTEQPVALPSP